MVSAVNHKGVGFLGQDLALEYKLKLQEESKNELEGIQNGVLDFGCMIRPSAKSIKENLENASIASSPEKNKDDESPTSMNPNPLMLIHPHQQPKLEHVNSNFLISPVSKPDSETKSYFEEELAKQLENTPQTFQSDETEATMIVNDEKYVPKSFNNAPLMVEDNEEKVDENIALIQDENIQYNVVQGIKQDDGEDTLRQYEFLVSANIHAGGIDLKNVNLDQNTPDPKNDKLHSSIEDIAKKSNQTEEENEFASDLSLLEQKLIKTTPRKAVQKNKDGRPKRPNYKKLLSGSQNILDSNDDLDGEDEDEEQTEDQISDSDGVKFQKKIGSNYLEVKGNGDEKEGNAIFVENEDVFQVGVSLYDMLAYEVEIQSTDLPGEESEQIQNARSNPTAHKDYQFILRKCMEKNFFSRFRVGSNRIKPFYIRMHPKQEYKHELKMAMLKINKYFVKKFQKVEKLLSMEGAGCQEHQEMLKSCEENLPAPDYDFSKKFLGLNNKMRRLMLSLKMMIRDPVDPEGGKRKAYTHLLNESMKLLSPETQQGGTLGEIKSHYGGELNLPNKDSENMSTYTGEFSMSSGSDLNLKSKLILKRLEVCLSSPSSGQNQPKVQQLMESIRDLEGSDNQEAVLKMKKDKFNPIFNFEMDFEPISTIENLPDTLISVKHNSIMSKITGNHIFSNNNSRNYLSKNFAEIDQDLVKKFYNTVLQSRLSSPVSVVLSNKHQNVGLLMKGFMIKYGNPINDEVTPDMILQYVKEVKSKIPKV